MKNTMKFIRSFAGIDEYILENGLKLLLFKEPSQANVTVNITYLVGSRHEGRGEAGMAHLLEHMLFKGTQKCKDVKGALQDRGASFNATTWFDRTNYFETLTPTKDNLEFALSLEADRMINSTILQEDLDAEMTVVRNEFEMGENNPVHVLHDQMMAAAYRWHNYGKTTIGNRSDIERVPVSKLKKFYEHYYQPDNAVLIIAGQFDKQQALDLVDRYFAPLKKPTRVLDTTYTQEPAQDGPKKVVLERVGDLANVALAYHIPSASHEDHAAVKLFMEMLTDEPSGLIYKELVASLKCSEIYSTVYALCEPGMAMCFVRPATLDLLSEVKKLFISLVEEKAVDFITDEGLNRVKARAYKKFKLATANAKDMALRMSESMACGDWRLFFWYAEQIKGVTKEDLIRVAKKYFIRSNRTLGVFIPIKEVNRALITCTEDIEQKLENLKENPDFSSGEEFIAKSENIERLTIRTNSKKVNFAHLVKKTRNSQVKSKLIFHFGNENNLKPYIEELMLLPSLFWRGCSKYNHQAIKDRLDSLLSSMEIYGGVGSVVVSIKSDKNNFMNTLSLLGDMLSAPTLLESDFNIIKKREIDDYEEIKNDPQKLALNELERLKAPVAKTSIHYVPTFDEKIEYLSKLKLENIQKAYEVIKWAQLDASLVGDFDCKDMAENLEKFLGFKSAADNFELVTKPFMSNKIEEKIIDTKDKEMALLAYAFNFALKDDDKDYPSLKLANYIFGENMNSRLMTRIREKEGISYGAGSWLEVSRHNASASFNMYAMSAPANISKAKLAMMQEWLKFLEFGVNKQEFEQSKISIVANYENMLANDTYLASSLANDFIVKRDFHWREKNFLSMVDLSLDEINSVIQKWFLNKEFSVVIAGDVSLMK